MADSVDTTTEIGNVNLTNGKPPNRDWPYLKISPIPIALAIRKYS